MDIEVTYYLYFKLRKVHLKNYRVLVYFDRYDYYNDFCLSSAPEPGEMIIGLVIYFFAFSTWEGRFLLIKDLLISPKHEG